MSQFGAPYNLIYSFSPPASIDERGERARKKERGKLRKEEIEIDCRRG